MEEQTFRGILIRFFYSFLWCFALGVVLGMLYHLPYENLRKAVMRIVIENSAPESFHLILVFSVTSLGLFVLIRGRTSNEVSTIRNIIGYRAAEIALALAAVFYGLLFGFSIMIWELPLLALGIWAFGVTVILLLALLWFSFQGNGPRNERLARLYSAILVIISFVVVWYVYFR